MTFMTVFTRLVYAVAALGFVALILTGSVGPGIGFVMLLGMVGSQSMFRRYNPSSSVWNIITLSILLWTALLFILFSNNSLDSAKDLLVYLQVNRLFQRKTNRDILYICLLAFSQILLASLLTLSPWFAVILIAFLLCSSWLLVLVQLKGGVDEYVEGMETLLPGASPGRWGSIPELHRKGAGKADSSEQQSAAQAESKRKKQAQYDGITRLFQRRWVLTTFLLMIILIVITVGLFMFIPRLELGIFQGEVGNPVHVAGFSEQVRLGEVGTILKSSGRVMRVRLEGANAEAALENPYWRGLALDRFDGQSWSLTLRQKRPLRKRMPWTWNRSSLPPNILVQRVTLEPIDTGVLFAISDVVDIELTGGLVYENGTGSYQSELGPQRVQYTVYSRLKQQDLSSHESPSRPVEELESWEEEAYLQLPPLPSRIAALAKRWTQNQSAAKAKAEAIADRLRHEYQYTLELRSGGSSPVDDFLFNTRAGHCEYFASAFVLLARSAGIPARIVNGFMGGEFNSIGQYWVIRQKDAHAWAEIWLDDIGWVRMDATPAGFNSQQIGRRQALAQKAAQYLDWLETRWYFYILEYDLRSQMSLLSELMVKFPKSARSSVYERGGKGIELESLETSLLAFGGAVLVLGLVWFFWRRRSMRQPQFPAHVTQEGRRLLDVRKRVHRDLRLLGLERQAGETMLERAARADQTLFGRTAPNSHQGTLGLLEPTSVDGPVLRLERVANGLLFGGQGGGLDDLQVADQVQKEVERVLKTRRSQKGRRIWSARAI